jgi:hypothetical protein
MKFNKYFPFAALYFFVNALALPFGLTYTTLLAPFFYCWILLTRKKDVLLPFFALLLPFFLLHWFVVGVDRMSYFISLLNLTGVYIFCQAVYTFFKVAKEPEKVFKRILVINFIFCFLGIIFYFTPWDELFWIRQRLTRDVLDFRRFRLFTYEASHYATMFIPLFFFYLLQYVFRQNTIKSAWLLPMLFLPFILSFSTGVILTAILAGILTTLTWLRQLLTKRRILNLWLNGIAAISFILVFLVLFYRDNPLFTRLSNIFSGADSSSKGRTSEAFILAQKMLEGKSEWWGIGLGQVKIVGHDIVQGYYLYNMEFVATIPNGMAETLAIFGWVGFSLKLLIEIGLFFITKVWSNYYQLMLFFFMFIFQFTGSFITNIAEYVIWILAFTNVFSQFNVRISQRPATTATITAS